MKRAGTLRRYGSKRGKVRRENAFFLDLITCLRPDRVLELACGSGRVTLSLAEAGAAHGFDVVGLELVPQRIYVGLKPS